MKTEYTNPHGAITEEIEARFETFVEGVKTKVANYYAEKFPNMTAPEIKLKPGSVYWKLIKETPGKSHGTSVYGFVRKADGAIFKAATWKAPFTKGPTAVRGYVTDESNGLDATTEYGIVYAR